MRNRILILVAVLAGAAIGALYGGVFRDRTSAASAALAGAQAKEDFKAGFSLNASTASLIADLQSHLRVSPKDEHSYTLLGLAYQQRARETGDPTWYSRSEGVLRRAAALDSKDYLAVGGLGSLALSRHRFRDALSLGEQARELNPYSARTFGVIGDAYIELGRYAEAFNAFDTMNRLRPSLSSYARTSYGRELIGHTTAAIKAMKLAIDAASGAAEPTAWTHVQLGKLYFGHGRIAAERQAVDAIPLPQYVAALGDLYRVTGRPVLARRQYALIGAIERLLHANGVKTELEIALFQADHGIALRHALQRARVARAERPSIEGDDVLGWTLARNGRCAEALPHSVAALRLGTQDALKFFHRGFIERCLGHDAAAKAWFRRALALNPHFSLLWTPAAKRWAA